MTQRDDVSIDTDWSARGLPVLVTPTGPAVELADWVAAAGDRVQELARTHGAVLFRGFGIADDVRFRAVMEALSPRILDYGERSSPRTQVASGIYTSTEYPATERILPHNEQSYSDNWPTKIVFCCRRPAARGGRTPLADSRRVLARLRPETVGPFEEHGVLYQRNYIPGISLSWQEAFQTDDRATVDAYCDGAGIDHTWLGADHLRTRQVRPAVHRHPVTGERTWFNHAHFFHVSALPEEVREGLLAVLDEDELPYQTYLGDGRAIPAAALADISTALDAESTGFDWEAGDVLVVENMITAHARDAYEGERTVLTAMADPIAAVTAR